MRRVHAHDLAFEERLALLLERENSGVTTRISILKDGLDRVPLEEQNHLELPAAHQHVRGADYYYNNDEKVTSC